jgi:hypothetical protein
MLRCFPPFVGTCSNAIGGLSIALSCGCQGAHLQAGPSIGYAFKRGTTLGWEAGAGGLGLMRASVGGTYRLEPPQPAEVTSPEPGAPAREDPTASAGGAAATRERAAQEPSPDAIHYLAFEPLGVSLGITFPDVGKPGFLGGVWAGWIFDPNPDGVFINDPDGSPFTPNTDCPDSKPESGLLLSAAIGLRYMGGEWEAYFTPKAVLAYCLEFAS